jgi:hypothetical protein
MNIICIQTSFICEQFPYVKQVSYMNILFSYEHYFVYEQISYELLQYMNNFLVTNNSPI